MERGKGVRECSLENDAVKIALWFYTYIVFCISLCLKYYRSKILERTRNERLRIDENSGVLKSV